VPFYDGAGRDRWDDYPRERAELIQWIRQKQVKGIVFISADLHNAAVARLPGNLGLKEIVTGPMAAPMNALALGYSLSFEFFSNQTFNYGMITIDPKASAPHALVEILDENNASLYKTRIDVI